MEKQVVAYTLEDGSEILVEVEVAQAGMVPAARGEVVEKGRQSLEKALASLRPAAQAVLDHLRRLSDPPDTITVEFGLKLGAEAGAILAASSMEAHYRITLTWKRRET